ncbi:LysR family transcriptional regulator, partial [Pseudomonas aeruginosa]|nr:LysR family transcriptional regulator [Pseudomonas aeruginosa]
GTGAIRTEDSLAYAEAARAIGADAILVGSPPYSARHGTPRCPEDLLRHTCLHYRFPNTGRLEEWPLRRADGEAPPQIPV